MDNFKNINDVYGHKVGDIVLILLVDIINKYLPKKSTLFRMGGDEFVIISTYDNLDDNHELMEQIRNELANHKEYGKIDFSYGIYVNNAKSPCSLYEMIDHADAIMYKNKAVHKMESSSLESEL